MSPPHKRTDHQVRCTIGLQEYFESVGDFEALRRLETDLAMEAMQWLPERDAPPESGSRALRGSKYEGDDIQW